MTDNPRVRASRLAPEERRQHLLDCAIQVFAAQGLVGGNHARVAALAHVSVPTVFFYFKTREALVDAVLAEVETLFYAAVSKVLKAKVPAEQCLRDFTRGTLSLLATHPDHARILTEWSVATRSESWPRYLKASRKVVRLLGKVVERGQQEGSFRADLAPGDAGAMVLGVGLAMLQMRESGAKPASLQRFLEAIIQALRVPAA
ncbi:MAG TPA: TetR/AcrR family transcriptional regulator [Macromonas sp.]|nr:TetR/AcrR family transcriptional regulator [Macromonas sp.]